MKSRLATDGTRMSAHPQQFTYRQSFPAYAAAALPSSACRTLSKTGWYAEWESVLAGDAPDHSYRIGRQRAGQERKHLVYGVDLHPGCHCFQGDHDTMENISPYMA